MTKKNIPTIISSCVLIALSLFSLVFAWFTFVTTINTNPVYFETARVESRITLYKGNDKNKDGYLDIVNGTRVFTLVQQEQDEEGNNKNLKLNFIDMMPTEIFTWKIEIENLGDVDGYTIGYLDSSLLSELFVKTLSVTFDRSDNNGYSSKLYLGNLIPPLDPLEDNIIFGGTYEDIVYSPLNQTPDHKIKRDYFIRFEFETFDNLIENGVLITYDEYQSLQGKSYSQLEFVKVILSSDAPQT
ncbi:hypothetical protein LJC17_01590 [Acholeplasma sp. OttesenSCG-928-E16]|nr:hypothetical protein [Acholeplasma sp. OttesenSCG-928-E16]